MSKYYFKNEGERCYPIKYWLQYMKKRQISEMSVFEAKREVDNGYFYCNEFDEVGEKGLSCGKSCKKYEPRNGISGICKYSGFTYEQTERVKILTL